MSSSNDLRIVLLMLCPSQRQGRASSNDDGSKNSRRLLLSAGQVSGTCNEAPDDNRPKNAARLQLNLEALAADSPRARKSPGYICLMQVMSQPTWPGANDSPAREERVQAYAQSARHTMCSVLMIYCKEIKGCGAKSLQ